jgi:hypothetical protein
MKDCVFEAIYGISVIFTNHEGARCVRRPGMYVTNSALVEVMMVLKW